MRKELALNAWTDFPQVVESVKIHLKDVLKSESRMDHVKNVQKDILCLVINAINKTKKFQTAISNLLITNVKFVNQDIIKWGLSAF